MRRLAFLLAFLSLGLPARAEDLIIVDLGGGLSVAVGLADGDVRPLGVFDSVTTITPDAPTPQPTDTGQVICIRPWSCTLDESDADLTIRESIDAAESDVPYFTLLPGVLNQDMQPHPAVKHYASLVPDSNKAWCFHVANAARGPPAIIHEGPLDAATVLGWIGVDRVSYAPTRMAQLVRESSEDKWLDVDFQELRPDITPTPDFPMLADSKRMAASFIDVATLPGFKPIPSSEWDEWCRRFPVERLAKSIRHVPVPGQAMGSCVGWSSGNNVEGGCYTQAGDQFFVNMSFMSMYHRIGRSPNSGAYLGDSADELFEAGILPADGQTDINGSPYVHTHQVRGGFYDKLPGGWEATANAWRCSLYRAKTNEAAFRVLMDWRQRIHIARSSHALSLFCRTKSGRWAYENSWGNWGDLGKCVGYDSRLYGENIYLPVARDELGILIADRNKSTDTAWIDVAESLGMTATTKTDALNQIQGHLYSLAP